MPFHIIALESFLIALTNDAAMMPSTNPAHVYELVALIVIFFLTSVIGVLKGGN